MSICMTYNILVYREDEGRPCSGIVQLSPILQRAATYRMLDSFVST